MPVANRRVLVTGAAGAMGLRLVLRLQKAGASVVGLTLPRDRLRARLAGLGCETKEGDVGDVASLAGLCDGVDTVYHLAAVILSHAPSVFGRINRDGTRNVLGEARNAGVEHFIYVSSASVTYPRRTPYAESKLQAENIVRAAPGIQHTIVRPTLVYDEEGGQELVLFRRYLERFPVVPFIGRGGAIKRPVWSEDVVDGLARLLGNSSAYGKTYNLSGAESITMVDFARLILKHAGKERPILPLPVPFLRAVAWALRLASKRPPLTASAIAGIVNDADLDPAEAMADLGYRPLGVTEGFRRCFQREAHASGGAHAPATELLPADGAAERTDHAEGIAT